MAPGRLTVRQCGDRGLQAACERGDSRGLPQRCGVADLAVDAGRSLVRRDGLLEAVELDQDGALSAAQSALASDDYASPSLEISGATQALARTDTVMPNRPTVVRWADGDAERAVELWMGTGVVVAHLSTRGAGWPETAGRLRAWSTRSREAAGPRAGSGCRCGRWPTFGAAPDRPGPRSQRRRAGLADSGE